MDSIHCDWKMPRIHKDFTSAVSLHGHTLHSKESMDFLVVRARQNAVFRWALEMLEKRCTSPKADLSNAYWITPLAPRTAYEIERDQILRGTWIIDRKRQRGTGRGILGVSCRVAGDEQVERVAAAG